METTGTDRPPERVGHYEILEQVGRGGMGVVYRARDVLLDRIAALKRPSSEYLDDPKHLARFRREAKAVARLSHPSIVPIYEVFDHEGVPWLAMEYEAGRSLREQIDAEGPLPIETVLRFSVELASALESAHGGGILHRDINPRNILISSDGRALLTDFGLARFFIPPGQESEATTQETQFSDQGKVMGTPGYMSPEQGLGKPLDPRTDIFSLGLVLYEMCTGKPAFEDSERGHALNAVLNTEPTAIARLNYEVPQELERIIRKAMAKRQDERYQHAADLLADLRVMTRVSSPISQPPERPSRRPRGLTLGMLVLLAAPVALIAVWALTRGSGGPTLAPDPLIAASEETRALIERGLQYLTQQDETQRSIEDAIQMFHRATEEEPRLGLGWALLGEANWRRYDRWGRELSSREEAVRAVNKAFRLDPELPEAFNARGYGHLLTGNITAAKVDFLPAVRGRPDLDRAWANLGHAHEKLDEYGPGITALNTAIRLRPDE